MWSFVRSYVTALEQFPFVMYFVLFVLGTVVGSFLNVCIYRLPDEEKSVVKPSSYCPSCRRPIAWHDNIPLMSYLMLRGHCRMCHARIPFGYFLIELITGLLFVAAGYLFGFSVQTFFILYVFLSLLVASIIDFKHKIIPDEITFYGMLVGLLASFFFPFLQGESDPRLGIANSILGLLIGGGIIYILAVIGELVFRREAMGGGDIKLLAMIGACFGIKITIVGFLLSPYFAICTALYYKFFKKEDHVPYGPFLSMGAVTAYFVSGRLLGLLGF